MSKRFDSTIGLKIMGVCDEGKPLTSRKVVDLLNKFNEDNIKLKQKLQLMNDRNIVLEYMNTELKNNENNLHEFFKEWFDVERGVTEDTFNEWWESIKRGEYI